jgi:hypothetical protein
MKAPAGINTNSIPIELVIVPGDAEKLESTWSIKKSKKPHRVNGAIDLYGFLDIPDLLSL